MLNSCASLFEDLTDAEILLSQQKYQEAEAVLATKQGSAAQKLLAKLYFDQAMDVLHQTDRVKAERYQESQDLLAKSLKLQPKNREARDFMRMLVKIQIKEGVQS